MIPICRVLSITFHFQQLKSSPTLKRINERHLSFHLKKMGLTATNQGASSTSTPPTVLYDLFRGHPNDHALPTAEIQSIMSSLLHEDHRNSLISSLGYGANAGNDELLSALRSFLNRRTLYDDKTEAADNMESQFFITNGVSHGIELLCSTCTDPGDEVWIERPTYFLVPKIFTSHGLVIKPLPMMSDRNDHKEAVGQINIDRLIAMVENDGVPPPKMMYVIPSYQNPTGKSMDVHERSKLAAFAIRNNILLVADEVYHLLDWSRDRNKPTAARPGSMTSFNTMINNASGDKEQKIHGCCISVSSFTKIFAPGIRVGWIEAPSRIIQRLTNYAYINSQGGVAPFVGRLMTQAIETGLLDQYLDKLLLEYSERCNLICALLEQEPMIKVLKSSTSNRDGGYFVWVQFPPQIDSEQFALYSLKEHGVRFMAGTKSDPFHQDDNGTKSSIQSCARLCFADLDRDKLAQATAAFIESFRAFVQLQS